MLNLVLTTPRRRPTLAHVARKLRVQYPGAIYNVVNRGDQREPLFRSHKDREMFLETLGQACEKTDWQVHKSHE